MLERKDIEQLLNSWQEGDSSALDTLIPLAYEELRQIAKRTLSKEQQRFPLESAELVNELYLRLKNLHSVHWENKNHFFGTVAQTMRRILADSARSRLAMKRAAENSRLSLESLMRRYVPDFEHSPDPLRKLPREPYAENDMQFLALNEALEQLSQVNEEQSRSLELHYFAGLTIVEISQLLKKPEVRVNREIRAARAWLREYLAETKFEPDEEGRPGRNSIAPPARDSPTWQSRTADDADIFDIDFEIVSAIEALKNAKLDDLSLDEAVALLDASNKTPEIETALSVVELSASRLLSEVTRLAREVSAIRIGLISEIRGIL